eukprot:3428714-Heterocapsa_arctica.AAC.1
MVASGGRVPFVIACLAPARAPFAPFVARSPGPMAGSGPAACRRARGAVVVVVARARLLPALASRA